MILDFITYDPNGFGQQRLTDVPTATDAQVLAAHGCAPSEVVLYKEWPSHAWPGGYPLFLITRDGATLCPRCANEHLELTLSPDDPQWFVTGQEINYEDTTLDCDHCGQRIEVAYEAEETGDAKQGG